MWNVIGDTDVGAIPSVNPRRAGALLGSGSLGDGYPGLTPPWALAPVAMNRATYATFALLRSESRKSEVMSRK
jgi:hypothetical protein